MSLENSILEFTQELSLKKNINPTSFNSIKTDFIKYFKNTEIFNSYQYTVEFYHQLNKKRFTGEPQVMHPLRGAIFLKQNHCDDNSIILELLHDVVEDAFSEKIKEFQKNSLKFWYYKTLNNKNPRNIENSTSKIYEELVNPNEKNQELNDIENNIFQNKSLGKKMKKYVKLISFKYYIPKSELHTAYNLETYEIYIQNIVKFSNKYQKDLTPLQAKIADRWDNSRTIEGLDTSKIERTLIKNEMLVRNIYDEIQNGLHLDNNTKNLLTELENVLDYEKNKDYTKSIITKNQRNELNRITTNSINIIKLAREYHTRSP